MQFSDLGTSGIKVSKMTIGSLHMGAFVDEKMTERILDLAIDRGINLIDTSPNYGNGNAEKLVGKYTKNRKNKVLIASKVGLKVKQRNGHFGVEKMSLTRENIIKSIDNSLSDLQRDCIDYFQLHCFDEVTPLFETFSTLSDLIISGKIRAFGVCNYENSDLRLVTNFLKENGLPSIKGIQCHYNLLERRFESELQPVVKKEKMGILCYQSLARGILSNKYIFGEAKPKNSRGESSARLDRLLTKKTLEYVKGVAAIAREYHLTPTQLALGWLLTNPQVSSIVLGNRNDEQLSSSLQLYDKKFPREVNNKINELTKEFSFLKEFSSRPNPFLET